MSKWYGIGLRVLAGVLLSGYAWAGNLDPVGAPGPTMHTLEDIYQKVNAFASPQMLSATTTTMNAGYYAATNLASVDTNLTTGNIRSGMTIFGVMGKTEVVDTTSGDAATGDIALGKKAWVKGVEVTGTSTGGGSFPAPVAKTGAGLVSGYTLIAGEDGYTNMQRGVAWPSPRFTLGTGVSSNCVTDNLTGLMWLRNPDTTTRSWSDAITYCKGLDGASGRGNYSDWRLANAKELMSLYDCGRCTPALPAGCPFLLGYSFSGVAGYFWASTTAAGNGGYAWAISFNDSAYMVVTPKSGGYYAWPVRGGQ